MAPANRLVQDIARTGDGKVGSGRGRLAGHRPYHCPDQHVHHDQSGSTETGPAVRGPASTASIEASASASANSASQGNGP